MIYYPQYIMTGMVCHRSNNWFSLVISDNVRQGNGNSPSLRYNKVTMKKSNIFSRIFRDERTLETPFFIFLTLVLVGIYIWLLISSPVLDSVWEMVLFTALMGLHIALYWASLILIAHPRWLVALVVIQGLLAFSMGILTRVAGITLGLYPGLVGLVIGLPFKRLWRVLAVGFILALSLANYLYLMGTGAALLWVLTTIPIVLFVTMYVTLYTRQVEAREKAQSLLKELEVANRQLTEFAAQVEDLTIAAERQRMARELHDTLSQGLAGLILQLEAVEAHLGGNRPERALGILQQSMKRARETLANSRLAIDNLRHDRKRNLEEAVRLEIDQFTDSTGIPCTLQIEIPANISEMVSEAVIRVTEEGFSNIARHANARKAWLRISYIDEDNSLEMEIRDDGIGFDPQQVEAGHYGLLGMRERVILVGGRVDVLSEAGKGTRILVRFPVLTTGTLSGANR